MAIADEFLAGVIEGFYGKPWSQEERLQLFNWMKEWGLNTYFYAPKDDLKHRALWREPYSESETEPLRANIAGCAERRIRFIYGIAPGLDIRYSDESEIKKLEARVEQMLDLGCRDFAILFDDIPDRMNVEDAQRFRSFAKAQCHVANSVCALLPSGSRFFFCPTAYCDRMARAKLGGDGYLDEIGIRLDPGIDVFWTGPDIISRVIMVEDMKEVRRALRRKPIIWDNLHANDYDGRRFFCGPYSDRAFELRDEVRGILINPNNEFPLNYIPIRTLASFIDGIGPDARQVYLKAMRDWSAEFKTVRGEIAYEDLVLFGDCYYLPYKNGADAERLLRMLRAAILERTPIPALTRLKECCVKMADLKNRSLFYALSRRVWELREEVDLLERCVTNWDREFRSDFHLPGTFRGGFVAELQKLLQQKEDGSFEP
jgi:protein O-GlcNAcase/histone acetyltransferase